MAAAIRDPDPVVFFEHKALYGLRGEVPDGAHIDRLGTAREVRGGTDAVLVALAAMVGRAVEAADRLEAGHGISARVLDLRTLVPLDAAAVLAAVRETGRLFTVEENPRLCGWGAEIAALAGEECFYDLDGPIVRITAPHVPLPAAENLERLALPSVERIVETVRANMG